MTPLSWTYISDRAIDRRREAAQKRVFQAALFAAECSREDPAFDWEHEQELKRMAIEEEERLARERWDSYVKPPTLGKVGLGLDMMFAPRGAFSTPRYEVQPDLAARPIDWMRTSFDDMKPLAEVREELRAKELVRVCSEEFNGELSVRLPSLSGRKLRVGESPPF
ncbi:unnamed protein product [Peniophora sp. CBMAI 1063]|nr:unnamed protein product [Peniophora sp. CBMAI 1063]